MAEKSFFWTTNATGDGTSGGYTALEMSEIWRDVILGGDESTSGVLRGVANELAVSGTSSPLAVNSGSAVVYGKFYRNTASVNLTVSTPSVGITGGHVILRLDWAAQTVRLVAVRNTDGVNATPSLTQSVSTQWEIRLASFTITTGGVITVTDARSYAHFASKVKTAMLDDSAVTAAKIATDSIDDTLVGNRVPQFYRRQGNSATDWSSPGTTTQTPTAVRMQAGVVNTNISGDAAITFPVAFSNKPLIFAIGFNGNGYPVSITSVSAAGCTVSLWQDTVTKTSGTVMWFAIGPE